MSRFWDNQHPHGTINAMITVGPRIYPNFLLSKDIIIKILFKDLYDPPDRIIIFKNPE